jgi:hypothetical protein
LQKTEFHKAFQLYSCESVKTRKAFTCGVGVKWFDAYSVAHEQNITVAGDAQAGFI